MLSPRTGGISSPMLRFLALLPLVLSAAVDARAASSEWERTEGASVRLLAELPVPGANIMRGALEIRLDPGWKTYWSDPGEAGVPPQIDASRSPNVSAAHFSFPVPVRLSDEYTTYAGYDRPVVLPVTFTLANPAGQTAIDATVFLGVCETICVPFSAEFRLDPADDTGSGPETAVIERAFASLPSDASAGLRIESATWTAEGLSIEAAVPSGGKWNVFVDGHGKAALDIPEPVDAADGRLSIVIPTIRAPKPGVAAAITVVVTDGSRSLTQTLTPDSGR